MIKRCLNDRCKNYFDDKSSNHSDKYCSRKCKDHINHAKKKEYYKEKARKWKINNPERSREIENKGIKKYFKTEKGKAAMKRNYEKNKLKWQSRNSFNNFIRRGSIKIKRKCKTCGQLNNLQIHHEVYHTKKKEIIKDIKEGRLYYLCKNCHKNLHLLCNPL